MATTSKSKSWRDVLPIHQAADLFPLMTPDELKALGEDIRRNGLTSPIIVWSELVTPGLLADGYRYSLLDGRNRLDAMEAVGVRFKFKFTGKYDPSLDIEGGVNRGVPDLVTIDRTDADPHAYVISANIHRRHLTAEQRRQLMVAVLKATPEKSNRQIAEQTKSNHVTVGQVRKELEKSGDVEIVSTRTDTKGRKQAAHKPPTKATAGTTANAVVPPPADIAEPDSTTEEEHWQRSLADFAGDAIALTAFWTREIGEKWKTFAVKPEHATLARQAAAAWTDIVEQLERQAHAKRSNETKTQTAEPPDPLDIPECLRRSAK